MTPSIELVREFHEAFSQDIKDSPYIGNMVINKLRHDLIQEEARELACALVKGDAVAVLDALTDLQYVLDGAFLALGFHRYKDAAMAEVHRSNMAKLGPDGKPIRREDGKILKPEGWEPPDLAAVLAGDLMEKKPEIPTNPIPVRLSECLTARWSQYGEKFLLEFRNTGPEWFDIVTSRWERNAAVAVAAVRAANGIEPGTLTSMLNKILEDWKRYAEKQKKIGVDDGRAR